MTSNANPFAAYDIAEKLRDCIVTYLEMTTTGVPPRQCIVSGQIAWDDCECGQLVVALQDGGEVVSFPDQQETRGRRTCGPPLFTWSYTVSILRCAPDGDPPSCDDVDAASKVAIEDAWAVRAGLICCLNDLIKARLASGTTYLQDYTLGRQVFVGPQGMCQGSEQPVTITMKNGCYPCLQS